MLYLMLVVVFSKLARMWWFFLLLGYCKQKNTLFDIKERNTSYEVTDIYPPISFEGPPLFFVVVGLGARHDYYGVKGDDGELSLCVTSLASCNDCLNHTMTMTFSHLKLQLLAFF